MMIIYKSLSSHVELSRSFLGKTKTTSDRTMVKSLKSFQVANKQPTNHFVFLFLLSMQKNTKKKMEIIMIDVDNFSVKMATKVGIDEKERKVY